MSLKVKQEIDCLKRLHEMTAQLDDIVMFLKAEGLLLDSEILALKNSADYSKDLQVALRKLQTTNKIQLIQYTWTILPVENIIIHLVTDRNQREFSFNG